MRAFVAVDLPESLRSALAEAQQEFHGACREVRWTRPEGVHLTLKFLGEISDEQAQKVQEALSQVGWFDPFSLEVKGFGFFPDARRPRVFWAGVSSPPALGGLVERVESLMDSAGFPREARSYSPHLTLARFQAPRPQPALESAAAARSGIPLGNFTVSKFFLFESKLSPQGARYRKVMRFP
jgi:2'-5' RNA ligase